MARAAAEGHRVVLVVATARRRGPAPRRPRRRRDARPTGGWPSCARSATVLGVRPGGAARLRRLRAGRRRRPSDARTAFADGRPRGGRPAARRDPARRSAPTSSPCTTRPAATATPTTSRCTGSAARAAELAGTPVVLEATVDRDLLRAGAAAGRPRSTGSRPSSTRRAFERAYRPRATITHRVDVRRYAGAQAGGDGRPRQPGDRRTSGDRTLAAFLRLPEPVFRAVFGREWFVERGRRPRAAAVSTTSSRRRAPDRRRRDHAAVSEPHPHPQPAQPWPSRAGAHAAGPRVVRRGRPALRVRPAAGDRRRRPRRHREPQAPQRRSAGSARRRLAGGPVGVHVRAVRLVARPHAHAGTHAQPVRERGLEPGAFRRRGRDRRDVRG